MKKHVFSLMMAFALILGLSAGAWAQTGVPLAGVQQVGSFANPKVYITGATDSLQIVRGVAGSTVDWVLYKGSDASTAATGADLDLIAHPSWLATQQNLNAEPARFRFKWTDAASGYYYLQVTETDQRTEETPNDRDCAVTVRGFHIFILGFDVAIYASDADGDSLTGDALTNCSGPAYPAFLNDRIMDVDGSIREDVLNTGTNPAENGTELDLDGIIPPIIGTTAHADRIRYYTAVLHFDTPTSGVFNPATYTVRSVRMDIKINIPETMGQDSLYVAAINSVDMQGDRASLIQSAVNVNLIAPNVQSDFRYTFAVDFNDVWGADLEPSATVQNVTLFEGADGGGINLGEEPGSYEDTVPAVDSGYRDNTSNEFTIFGKPATGPIIIH